MKKIVVYSIFLLCIIVGNLNTYAQKEQNPLNYQYYILGNQKVTGKSSATLSNIEYKGFSSSVGNIISAQKTEDEKFEYQFNNITTNPKINLDKKLLYWRQEEDGVWVYDSEAGNGIANRRLDKDACFVLVLDCSSSIGDQFFHVQNSAIEFIEKMYSVSNAGNIRIGIIRFSTMDDTEVFPIAPLTESNLNKIKDFIDKDSHQKQATSMYYAINNGIDNLSDYINKNNLDVKDRHHIITFTDGLDNTSQLVDLNLYTATDVESYVVNQVYTTRINSGVFSHSVVFVPGEDVPKNRHERMKAKLKRLVSGEGQFMWVEDYQGLTDAFSELAENFTVRWTNLYCTSALNHNGPVCWTYGEPKTEVSRPKPLPKRPSSILNTGYRGIIDFGYGVAAGYDSEGRIEISTAHGYQFNKYLFAGVGIGFNYFHYYDEFNVPIFADLRGTLPINNTKIAPYVDMRIGYSLGDYEGFYFSPSVGVRFGIGKDAGISFSIGYELQNYNYDYYKETETCNAGAVTFRLGFDF